MTGSRTVFVLSLALLSSWAGAAQAASISGQVRYEGDGFRAPRIHLEADPKCVEIVGESQVPAQSRLVSPERGIANAFVYIKDPPADAIADAPAKDPVVLSQKGCLYAPRVLGIMTGQPLTIENDDPTLHNVRCLAESNPPFNISQPPNGSPRRKIFRVTETPIPFKCDVHPWMAGYLFVLDHPFFAVSGNDGAFTLEDAPTGQYTLVVWHESFGEKELSVEVGPSGLEGLTISFDD